MKVPNYAGAARVDETCCPDWHRTSILDGGRRVEGTLTGRCETHHRRIPTAMECNIGGNDLEHLLLLDCPTFAADHPERSRGRRFKVEVSCPIFSSLWIGIKIDRPILAWALYFHTDFNAQKMSWRGE